MALTSGFFSSKNGDRKYSAQQFGELIDGLITDGIVKDFGDKFKVTPGTGLSVNVGTGRAWFHNTWTYNSAKENIELLTPSLSMARIDAITLEINKSSTAVDGRKNKFTVIRGNYDVEATKPDVASHNDPANGIWFYPLAYVTIRANTSSITDNDIELMTGTSECPISDYHCLTADFATKATDADRAKVAISDSKNNPITSYLKTATISNRVLQLFTGDGDAISIDIPDTVIPNDYVTTITASGMDLTYKTKAGNSTNVSLTAPAVTKSSIGLGNVDNVKQMPIAGGTFTGWVYAPSSNTSNSRLMNTQVMNSGGAAVSTGRIIMYRK